MSGQFEPKQGGHFGLKSGGQFAPKWVVILDWNWVVNLTVFSNQPAQKWLKDRKERELSYEDILHYQKIIVALTETDILMKEVDKVGVL